MADASVERLVSALRAGELAVIPTDTVYGIVCTAFRAEPAARLYAVKGRPASQPTAIVCASVDVLLRCVPELRGPVAAACRALLPGPYTLVVPNPARRYGWVCGDDPDSIGVRVPPLEGPVREVLDAVGAVVATSANLPGGRDPRRLEDVPVEIRDAVAACLDAGELPGVPSTVLDLTGNVPRVVREGAVAGADALKRAAAALT